MNTTMRTIILLAGICLIGCGGSQDKWTKNRPPVYPVQGVLREGGQPLVEATVIFQPKEGNHAGVAVSDRDGKYELTTFEDHDGATAGDFLVSVEKNIWVPQGTSADDPVDSGTSQGSQGALRPIRLTADQYVDFEKSGFTATVTADGPNTFDFDLEPKAK